ncbi:MAG: hypothetical protein Q9M50_02300 [Methylococcales bacterium]|nr:hypothetical protein [Methylococcales bacterium]
MKSKPYTRSKRFSLIVMLMLTTQIQAEMIDKQFKYAFSNQDFVSPDTQQLTPFKIHFKQALQTPLKTELWQSLGFKSVIEPPFVFLSEQKIQGRGFIALRSEKTKPWLLQAPHAKSDLHTGKIARLLFSEGRFKAAIWNSVPRKKVDMAHNYQSYWQAVTQVFAENYPQGRIIQLHGFSAKKRKTAAGRNSDMIISAGNQFPPLWVQKVADCLKARTEFKVSLYPYEVTELGARTNSQGQLLQSLGHQGFLHLEMNKKLRDTLLKHVDLRQQLLVCLAEGE